MKTTTGARLKQLMSERGLKQVDIINKSLPFQKKFGVKLGKSALSQYINDIQSPDQNKIYLLAKTLNVSIPWLMGYNVPMIEEKEDFKYQEKSVSSIITETVQIMQQLDESSQANILNFAKYEYSQAELAAKSKDSQSSAS